jgi:peroxin-6
MPVFRLVQSDGITLPSSWNESNVISAMGEFDNRTWKVSISRPRTFTTIFVNALCREDYEAACTHHERFEAWLSQHQRIIRRGMTLNMPGEVLGSSVARCRYKIVMTEPHSMGLVDIATTRIILTPSNTPQNQQTDEEHASPTISLVEELEIGEDFLASSVLSPAIPENTSASHTHPSSLKDGIASPLQLRLHYLPAPVSLTDDHTLYLRTNDLSKLGVLSGDWVRFI